MSAVKRTNFHPMSLQHRSVAHVVLALVEKKLKKDVLPPEIRNVDQKVKLRQIDTCSGKVTLSVFMPPEGTSGRHIKIAPSLRQSVPPLQIVSQR